MDERVLEDFLSFSSSQTEDSVDRPNAGSARVCAYQSWHVAARDLADLRIDLPHPVSHLAVFESYRSQRIVGTGVRQAKARDLLGSEAVSLSRCDGELTISGDTIRSIGLSGATPGDRSEPGLLITFLGGR